MKNDMFNPHPLVWQFFGLVQKLGITKMSVCRKAGLHENTMYDWQRKEKGHNPNLDKFERALNAIGYTLKIVPIANLSISHQESLQKYNLGNTGWLESGWHRRVENEKSKSQTVSSSDGIRREDAGFSGRAVEPSKSRTHDAS